MPRKYKTTPYRRGYVFEKRVQKEFEKSGFYVIRQGKSAFPDLIIIGPQVKDGFTHVIMCECKVGKYLSKEEKLKAQGFIKLGFPFIVASREGRKIMIEEVK